MKSPLHNFSFIFLGIVLIMAFLYYTAVLKPQKEFYDQHHVPIHGTYLIKSIELPEFTLKDQYENNFTKQQFLKHWTLLYFGFTHCESICPTTMHVITQSYNIIKNKVSKEQLPQVVFITIDPERDTPQKLTQYLSRFNPNFIGLRGSAEQTSSLEKQLHIPVSKDQANNWSHGMDILLINPDAKIQAYFHFPHKPSRLANEYQQITEQAKSQKNDS
jgi:protein SCO1/2